MYTTLKWIINEDATCCFIFHIFGFFYIYTHILKYIFILLWKKTYVKNENPLEEILSISTLLSTWPSSLSLKKCINKSICWHPEGTRGLPMEGAPPVANQIDLFMHFLGDSVDGLVERRVEMDKISSSDLGMHPLFFKTLFFGILGQVVFFIL